MSRRGPTALLLLLAAAAASWAWWRWAPQSLPVFARNALPASPAARPENPPLYKWRDAKGQWQVTDTPPRVRLAIIKVWVSAAVVDMPLLFSTTCPKLL